MCGETLAIKVTELVHGKENSQVAQKVTELLVNPVGNLANPNLEALTVVKKEIPTIRSSSRGSIVEALASSGLASSNTEARRLLNGNAISINGKKVTRENFQAADFQNGRLLLRRGKAFKDSALVELEQ